MSLMVLISSFDMSVAGPTIHENGISEVWLELG